MRKKRTHMKLVTAKEPAPPPPPPPQIELKLEERQLVPLNLIKVDTTYQRGQKKLFAKVEAHQFNPVAFGHVVLSLRDNGEYYAIDGQQRTLMLRELCVMDQFRPDGGVPSIIHRGMSRTEEAEQFLFLNRQAPMQVLDKWKARLVAREPEAVAIDAICTRARFYKPQCVSALQKAFDFADEQHPKGVHLKATLAVVRKAWGRHANLRGLIVYGIAYCLYRNADIIDFDALVGAVNDVTQESMIDAARNASNTRRYKGMQNAIYGLIVEKYNKNTVGPKLRLPTKGKK